MEVAPHITPASIFWNDLTNGNALYSEDADKLYQEIKKQSEKEQESAEESAQTGDTYDYYMCVGEVPESEVNGDYISLAELEHMKNMEVFGCDDYVDERELEESEELSDDEDSNAEDYWEKHMIDSSESEDAYQDDWDIDDEEEEKDDWYYGDDPDYCDDAYCDSDYMDDDDYYSDD